MSNHQAADSTQPLPANLRWCGAAVLALALIVRVAFLIQLRGTILFDKQQGDAQLHYNMAREIAGGDWLGQRVFYLAPLYPYFVAAIFATAGTSVLAVALVQVALSTLEVWIIMTIGRKLFGPAVGTTAGCMAACYGPFVFYTGFLLKETLGLVLLDGFVLLAVWLVQRGRWWCSVFPGLLFGLASLVRPNLLPVAMVVALWLWFQSRGVSWARQASAILLFAAGVSIAVLPVAWRNYGVGKEWVLISAHGGHNFFIGNRPGATGLYDPLRSGGGQTPYDEEHDAREIAELATGKSLRASAVSAYWYARGWREVCKDPGNFVRVTLRKLALFWNDYEIPDFQDFYFLRRECPVLWLAPLTVGLAAPLAVWGIVVSRRRWRDCLLLYLLIVGVLVTVIPFFIFARYRLPVVPTVLLFAAVGVTSIGQQIMARDWLGLRPAIACVVAVAVVVNWPLYRPIDFLATSYFNIGGLYRDAGRTLEAESAWAEAVRLNADYRKPHRALGELYFESDRFGEAIDPLSRAAPITATRVPADADVCYMLGVSFLNAGDLESALRVLRGGHELWPNDDRFTKALARAVELSRGTTPQ